MNATDTKTLRREGERRKQAGMALAADARPDAILAGKIAMLRALLASPDGTATIDDATPDLAIEFGCGGKWRGSVCLALAHAGQIVRVGVELSKRPSRHRGYVTRWRLVNRSKARLLLSNLLITLDAKLSTGATLAAAQSETPAATFGECTADVSNSQPTDKKGNQSHG